MSNSAYTGKIINLDTFASAITLPNLKVFSLEWTNPQEVGDECLIRIDDGDGLKIVHWTCAVQFKGDIKYFDSIPIVLHIPANAIVSGELIIIVR